MADIEVNIPVNVKLTRVIDDNWTAKLTRKSNDKEYWVGEYRNLSPAEVYTKFGAKVPVTKKVSKGEGKSEAVDLLSEHLTNLNGRTIVNTSEVQDLLLDIINLLGQNEGDDLDASYP